MRCSNIPRAGDAGRPPSAHRVILGFRACCANLLTSLDGPSKLSEISDNGCVEAGSMPIETPTERELQILEVLWDRGEASVREVHEELSKALPIVQNTVQAFLRTMEEKGLVRHRLQGRTFIYQPVPRREET